ncbi:MAG: translocation/assembly module TamB [Flavobacteriales bacterium]|nr:translocation/assembly module TamB [Flavobacteriales bacterium]MCB9363946.1 translocation/assembly module TamB [Flavobacteriales bacterium]
MAVFLLLLVAFGVATTKSANFQTYLIHQYLNSLAKKLKTTISVESVKVSFFSGVTLQKLYVEDLHQDTLAFINHLNVDLSEFSFQEKRIVVDEVNIDEAYFNLKKYKQDSTVNLTFIINHFKPKDTAATKNEWIFELDKVNVENGRFDYNNEHVAPLLTGVDYNHVGIEKLNLKTSGVQFIPSGVNCNIEKLSLIEKSGFELNDLKTEFNISPKGIVAQHLKVKTPNSSINGDVTFITNEYADLANFIDDVKIQSYFEKTAVNFKDICFFATGLDCLNKKLTVTGEVKGRINNLKGRKLDVITDDGTIFKGDVKISGLPDVENMFMHINVNQLITSKSQLEQLPLFPFCEDNKLELPSNFNHLGKVYFKGSLTGFYYDFVAYGKFKTAIGTISTDVKLNTINNEVKYVGKVETNHFHIGKFFEIPEEVGEITMNVDVDGGGTDLEKLKIKLNGNVEQIVIKDYEYNNVKVKGNLANKIFKGFLAVEDENIDFDFDGFVDFREKLPIFNFVSNINYAKLQKLNLIKLEKDLRTRLSTQLTVNLVGNHIDNIVGDIKFRDLNYIDIKDSIYVKDIDVKSQKINELKKLSIVSEIFEGKIEGRYSFKELLGASTNNLVKFIPSLHQEDLKQVKLSNDFNFDVKILNTELISKLLLSGVELGDNSNLHGAYNSTTQSLSLNAYFPTVNSGIVKVNNLKIDGKTSLETLFLDVFAEKIYQTDSVYIENFNTSSVVQNDSILTNIKWANNDIISKTEANINFNTYFRGLNDFTTHFYDSYFMVDDTLWLVNENNKIDYFKEDTLELSVQSLGFKANNQSILIDGKISGDENDQIDIALKRFNLSIVQKFIPANVINVKGIVDGVLSVKKEKEELILTSDIMFNDLNINHSNLGSGEVKSVWSTVEKKLYVDGQFYKGHLPSIIFNGNYFPFKETESLDLVLQLQRTDLKIINNYTKNYIDNLRGLVTADIAITGTIKEPALNGYVQLQKTSFEVNYLKTGFSTPSCKINVTPDMISFDNVWFFDGTGRNKAIANGTIFHEWFKDFNFDVGLDANDFLAMNTAEKDNNLYYGKAFISGLINIGGYSNKLSIDLDVKTEKGTVISIPLSNSDEISENDFIEFVTNDTIKKIEEEIDLSNIIMNFDLEATPDAEVRLVFDEQIGDVMKATGEGDLEFRINQQGDFNIYGDYKVKDGDYLFTLQNIINKRFDLEEGGTIKWNGDPYDAQLNLTAVYRLRARLYELLAGAEDSATAAIYKKRTPVNLKLIMTKSMLNPDIAFDIDLPTADETTKSKVRSILYVSDQQENIQELNKQVFSLLVLNQFIPPNGQGGGTYGNVAGTTSSELLSNQVSNWLSKISNDFDVGFNYRPGDELSSQEVELALSTQIFNDRLILDGNFGMSENKNVSTESQNANNIIGDFSMEYKITEDGKLRVKAFNTSNQSYIERTSSNYTQGIGLFYRKEFDNFSDLFKRGIKNKSGKQK